jgi:hypothetical protein
MARSAVHFRPTEIEDSTQWRAQDQTFSQSSTFAVIVNSTLPNSSGRLHALPMVAEDVSSTDAELAAPFPRSSTRLDRVSSSQPLNRGRGPRREAADGRCELTDPVRMV